VRLERQLNKVMNVRLGMKAYDLILDSVLFFLFFTLIIQLAQQSMIYVVPLTILAILFDASLKLTQKKNIVDEIESREKTYDGSLKTAYEYQHKRNLIVDDLMIDTSKKLTDLKYSVFLNNEGVAERIALAVFMAFIIISVLFVRFQDFMLDA